MKSQMSDKTIEMKTNVMLVKNRFFPYTLERK